MNSTIAAIATPIGESAIGIIRLSGPLALDIAEKVFLAKSGRTIVNYQPRTMIYGSIVYDERVYDEVMLVHFKAPFSYTRDEMIEIFTHGSAVALKEILHLLIELGATPASPGEFTKLAFLNGRIDLVQAEAVMDMISAKTKKGFEVAYHQLEGKMSQRLLSISDGLTDLMAQIEVVIDYPDEDVEIISKDTIYKTLLSMVDTLKQISDTYGSGRILKEGLSLIIIGKPNVGKSSLLNALLRDSRAIVTDIAGTTRDIIEEAANIQGIPIKLVDTAGIRETDDMIEKIGVARTKEFFNKADMALLVLNSAEELSEEDRHVIEIVKEKKLIVIINKIDLESKLNIDELKLLVPNVQFIFTSLINNEGIDLIENAIVDDVLSGKVYNKSSDLLTNARQYDVIKRVIAALGHSADALQSGMPLDVIEIDILEAYNSLGEITGRTVHEDVIGRIFEKFCLGK